LASAYVAFLRWGLRRKAIVISAVAGVFVVSMALAPQLAAEFFPKVDAGEFILHVAAPEGTRLEKTEAIVGSIEEIIRKDIPQGELDQIESKVRDVVASVHGTLDVRVRQGMDYPEIHLNVDHVKAGLLGLTEQQVLSDVVTALSSNISGDPGYWIDPKTNNAYFVVAQYPEQNLTRFEDFLLTPLIGTRITDLPVTVAGAG